MILPFVEQPPDVIDPGAFDFGEVAGVPGWVPLAAQLIPWIVGLAVDPDADHRQRVLVSALLSGVLAAVSIMTGEAGATFSDVLVAFLTALLSAQLGYGLAKGLTNGKINELSTRSQPMLPPGYQPPYGWTPTPTEPPPQPYRQPRYYTPEEATRPLIRYASQPHRRHPTEEVPVVRWAGPPAEAVTTAQWAARQPSEARTTFQYPTTEPEPPPNEGGRRYV